MTLLSFFEIPSGFNFEKKNSKQVLVQVKVASGLKWLPLYSRLLFAFLTLLMALQVGTINAQDFDKFLQVVAQIETVKYVFLRLFKNVFSYVAEIFTTLHA